MLPDDRAMHTELGQLLDDQHGVAKSSQILALISRRAFETELKTGSLERIWQGIYCRGEPNNLLRLRGLDLTCGTKVATCLGTAAAMHGFDTVAEGLRLSTLQMEKYLEAADQALDAAINLGPEPKQFNGHWLLKDEKGVRQNLDTPEGKQTNPVDPKSKHRHVLRELPDAITEGLGGSVVSALSAIDCPFFSLNEKGRQPVSSS